LNGEHEKNPLGAIGGLHRTSDGYVRIHDGFPNHRDGALELLGLSRNAARDDVAEATLKWKCIELETEAFRKNIVIAALRSYEEWDILPQAQAISGCPISVQKAPGNKYAPKLSSRLEHGNDKALRGLRVVELSRVIAAPVAGKTLAAHGADVLWVTSPNLPDLPNVDRDVSRGKRTIQLDLKTAHGKRHLVDLIRDADVFIQGYRPGSLLALGFSPEELVAINPHIIIANLSAYGPSSPWTANRGFDSLVQTCSGMNVSEAQHFNEGQAARPLPCQALDHASGYFLATAIITALYRQATQEGGAYITNVSLAGTMKYLRSMGQYPEESGFDCEDVKTSEYLSDFMETRQCGYGELIAVKHAAKIEGVDVGWEIMPKELGSDEAKWL
jgi:hypothetical protein